MPKYLVSIVVESTTHPRIAKHVVVEAESVDQVMNDDAKPDDWDVPEDQQPESEDVTLFRMEVVKQVGT